MYFIGVTTGKSATRKLFPVWAEILGIPDTQLIGIDLPLQTSREQYRSIIEEIKASTQIRGALVTTHKIKLLKASWDLFDELSDTAKQSQEVSCIYKHQDRLIAHAIDPFTCSQAMALFIPPAYWRERKSQVLCLGAGGAAISIGMQFAIYTRPTERPTEIIFVDKDFSALQNLRGILENLPGEKLTIKTIQNADPHKNDQLLSNLPAGSLVINATGMGKDLPGSPITDRGIFPEGGIVWELNYRGELEFLHQARAQQGARDLLVMDGWDYFLIGWAMIISTIFDLPITTEVFRRFKKVSDSFRKYDL